MAKRRHTRHKDSSSHCADQVERP